MTTDTLNNPLPSYESRRRKSFIVPRETVAAILFPNNYLPDRIKVARALNMPPTAKLVCVYDDYARASFAFVVEDPSFDQVPMGCMLPEVRVTWEVVELDRKPEQIAEDPAQLKINLG